MQIQPAARRGSVPVFDPRFISRWLAAALALGACAPAERGYREQLDDYRDALPPPARPAAEPADPLAGAATLAHDAVVRAVLDRNPSLDAARAAWRGALARYSQATALDDPMLAYAIAPLSPLSDDVRFGHSIELSQALPYPGKRRLRGEIALAEAAAARADLAAAQLRLAAMASSLYFELYLHDRSLEQNEIYEAILRDDAATVTVLIETGRAGQDDANKVALELAEIRLQRIAFEAAREVAAAQLSELMHRPPARPLPPLPERVDPPRPPGADVETLAARAQADRPELRALAARERGAGAARALAQRDFYPDLRVRGTYTTMFSELEHQLMIGVAINLPVWRERRRAAVDQAQAGVARARAERARQADDIAGAVTRAASRLRAALAIVARYESELLPAARDRVDAMRVRLDTGRTSFLEVLRAERELRQIELRLHVAVAEAHQRRAELALALGELPLRDEGGRR